MAVFHDEVEIEDFEYDEEDETYYYPCPCGDRFQISKISLFCATPSIQGRGSFKNCNLSDYSPIVLQEELKSGIDIATCPSCSLVIKVIYDQDQFAKDDDKLNVPNAKKNLETN